MAWFNDENAADTPRPVTAERIMDVIKDKLKFSGNEESDKFYCYINGVPIRFDASPLNFAFFVNATMFDRTLPGERYDELLNWVSQFNKETHFVSSYLVKNEEDNTLMAVADAPVVVEAGMSDTQLQNALEHVLTGVIVWAHKFCEDFGFKLDEAPASSEE